MSHRSRSHSRHPKSGSHNLRIIGGQWRGRKLSFVDSPGLRPTGDRIRETLFNWLAPVIPGAHCLDLFTGSGALGLEALSRGAARVVMIDRERPVTELLRRHTATLGTTDAQIEEADALQWLEQQGKLPPEQQAHIDIAFLDPPFSLNLWQAAVDALEASGLLSDDATLYIETPFNYPLSVPANWSLHREKRAGQVSYRLYHRLG